MPFRLISMRAPIRRSPTLLRPFVARRTFQSCRVLAAGKESELHNEDRAEKVDKVKQEQVKKAQDGRSEWNDTLASDSESIVKADRNEYKDSKDTIAELEQETAKAAEEEHRKEKA